MLISVRDFTCGPRLALWNVDSVAQEEFVWEQITRFCQWTGNFQSRRLLISFVEGFLDPDSHRVLNSCPRYVREFAETSSTSIQPLLPDLRNFNFVSFSFYVCSRFIKSYICCTLETISILTQVLKRRWIYDKYVSHWVQMLLVLSHSITSSVTSTHCHTLFFHTDS